jgi:hypothetical protein
MATVKQNIRDLGEVITFMHAPTNSTNLDYGTTHRCKSDTPSFHSPCEKDWPPCPDQFDSNGKRRLRPCIVLNQYFQNYFRDHNGWYAASNTSRYRTLFLFAITLVHEFAHAYWNWLHRYSAETCWNISERVNELGFSWERQVIGRVVCPVQFRNAYGYRILYSAEIQEYTNPQEYWNMEGRIRRLANAHLTSRDAEDKERTWPLLEPSDMHGSQLYMPKRCKYFLVLVTCLPMDWVVGWFREKYWADGRKVWEQNNSYLAQPVQKPSIVIYKRTPREAWVYRPLRTDSVADGKILKEMEQGAQR